MAPNPKGRFGGTPAGAARRGGGRAARLVEARRCSYERRIGKIGKPASRIGWLAVRLGSGPATANQPQYTAAGAALAGAAATRPCRHGCRRPSPSGGIGCGRLAVTQRLRGVVAAGRFGGVAGRFFCVVDRIRGGLGLGGVGRGRRSVVCTGRSMWHPDSLLREVGIRARFEFVGRWCIRNPPIKKLGRRAKVERAPPSLGVVRVLLLAPQPPCLDGF